MICISNLPSLTSLNWVYSGRPCDFNRQGRNTKRVRMFQAMPLQYFKDDGFNHGRFKMTKNYPLKLPIEFKNNHFWHTFYFPSHFFPFFLIDLISNFPGKGVLHTPGNSVKY